MDVDAPTGHVVAQRGEIRLSKRTSSREMKRLDRDGMRQCVVPTNSDGMGAISMWGWVGLGSS